MAWEWSHSPEAYENAEFNLRERRGITFIRECWAEWKCWLYERRQQAREQQAWDDDEDCPDWTSIQPYTWKDGLIYKAFLKQAKARLKDCLVDDIWTWASNEATCDNGGWNAWVCPTGCHTVSFDKERK